AGGERFLVKVTDITSVATPYDFKLEWFPTFDCFEHNDVKEDAKRISVGDTIAALTQSGWTGTDDSVANIPAAPLSDWYVSALGAGPATVAATSVPSTSQLRLTLYDANGNQVGTTNAANPGASVSLNYNVAASGDFFLRVEALRNAGGVDASRQ